MSGIGEDGGRRLEDIQMDVLDDLNNNEDDLETPKLGASRANPAALFAKARSPGAPDGHGDASAGPKSEEQREKEEKAARRAAMNLQDNVQLEVYRPNGHSFFITIDENEIDNPEMSFCESREVLAIREMLSVVWKKGEIFESDDIQDATTSQAGAAGCVSATGWETLDDDDQCDSEDSGPGEDIDVSLTEGERRQKPPGSPCGTKQLQTGLGALNNDL